jgi:hypothetical protein
MKLMAWAVGSVLISLMLALAIGAVVSAAAGAAELPGCPHARAAAHAEQRLAHPNAGGASGGHRSYLIATRMGWAIS